MKRVLLLISLIAAFSACNRSSDKSSLLAGAFSEESNVSFFEDVFSETVITPVKDENAFVGNYMCIIFETDGVHDVILDYEQGLVHSVDRAGNVIGSINKVGKGPGEYVFIKDMALGKDGIILLADSGRLLFYGFDGSFTGRQFQLDFISSAFSEASDGSFVFFTPYPHELGENNSNNLIFTDSEGKVTGSSVPFEYCVPLGYRDDVRKVIGEDAYLASSPFSGKIYRFSPSSGTVETYDTDFKDKSAPKELLEADGDYEKMEIAMENADIFYVCGAFENKDYLLMDIAHLEDMEEKAYGIWLFDKKTGKSLIQHYSADSPEFLALGIPVGLTEDNEVVFIGTGEYMEGISGYKCFSGMDQESLEGMNIIRLKIDI